jgi:hypothetical protein
LPLGLKRLTFAAVIYFVFWFQINKEYIRSLSQFLVGKEALNSRYIINFNVPYIIRNSSRTMAERLYFIMIAFDDARI